MPIVPASDTPPPAPAASLRRRRARPDAAPPAGAAQARADASLVIVDDEALNSEPLAAFLRGVGYLRIAILRFDEATAQTLSDEQPDLVLLGLALNPANGFGLLGAMQADRTLRHVPVIALTSEDDRANRLRALELGAADFLVRPVDARELDLRVRNTLAAKAYRDRLAHTDHVTGLPNRESLTGRLDAALRHSQRHGNCGGVLQLGLDRFRQINDALGPAVGDALLHAVAQRLASGLRDSDTVAGPQAARTAPLLSRGSGDEFTLLLPWLERVDDAAVVARRMIERMNQPFGLAGHELVVSCRIGISAFPHDGADKDSLLKQASVAMRHARQHGGGFQFYSEALNSTALHRIDLERELRHALERSEFVLHYQAQADVTTGQVCGAEALVRWQHPTRGLLGPGEFIEVAEESGLIGRLGDWVLRESLRQLAAWRGVGLVLPQIAVNVSSLQLQRAELCDDVRDALRSAGVDGASLCVELTESAIIESGPQVAETLAAIKRLGVCLALDDFGTGYSSLTYLRRFPIDELKIDRSFVTDCDTEANNSAITAAIVAMSHSLGLRVVAEGVETPAQLAFIRAHGADRYQGYLFERPLPAAAFGAMLAAGRDAGALGPAMRSVAIPTA